MKILRALYIALAIFAAFTLIARASGPALVVTETPTGLVSHNFTSLSGSASPGSVGYQFQTYGTANTHKASVTYNAPITIVTGANVASVKTGGNLQTQIWSDGVTPNITGTQQSSEVIVGPLPGSSFTVDFAGTGLSGGSQVYTANFFLTNYCTNATWTLSADDASFNTQTGTISETAFGSEVETLSAQFNTSAANSGLKFTYTSNGANCDGANAYIGFGGYTLTTGAQPNPDGTPAPSPTPVPTATPVATPTPLPTAVAPTTYPYIPGGSNYNGQLNAYAHPNSTVAPIQIQQQPGATQDYLQVYSPGQVQKTLWIDSNGILHTNGGTSLLAYNSSGVPINATAHSILLNGTTPSTSSSSCGPFYPTGSYYCLTLTLPTGVAAFSNVSTGSSSFGVNGTAQSNGSGVWYSVLGGTLFNANWNSTSTLYVGSSVPSQGFTLQLFGY